MRIEPLSANSGGIYACLQLESTIPGGRKPQFLPVLLLAVDFLAGLA
jgi:hypothetical protein